MTLLQEGNFKEIFKTDEGNCMFKMRKIMSKNYEQNRKFCVVEVETLEKINKKPTKKC